MFVGISALSFGKPAFGQQQPNSSSPAQLEQWLSTAEELRTRSPKEVALLLADIENNSQSLTQQQRHRVQLLKAHQFAIKGEYQSAKTLLEQLQTSSMHPNQHMRSLYLLSKLAELQTDYEQAFVHLNRAIQLPTDELSTEAQFEVLLLAGALFTRAKAFSMAGSYSRQAIELAKAINSPEKACSAQATLAMGVRQEGNPKLAMRDSLEQVKVCTAANEPLFIANGQLAVGFLHLEQEQLEDARLWLHKAQDNFERVEYASGLLSTHVAIAKLEVLSENIAAASMLIDEALVKGERYEAWDDLALAYPIAANIAEDMGELQKAIALHKKYVAADEKVRSTDKAIRLAYLQTQFKVEQFKRKLSLEDKAKTIVALEHQAQHLWSVIIILSWVTTIAAGIVVYLLVQRKRRISTEDWAQEDALTGVLKQGFATKKANTVYQKCLSDGVPFVVMVAEINQLDYINNHFGHDVGDIVRRAVADRLKANSPESAIIARSDVDGFCLFLPGTNVKRANELNTEYQHAVNGITVDGRQLNVSLSCGMALAQGQGELTDLMTQAQQALKAEEPNVSSIVTVGS